MSQQDPTGTSTLEITRMSNFPFQQKTGKGEEEPKEMLEVFTQYFKILYLVKILTETLTKVLLQVSSH